MRPGVVGWFAIPTVVVLADGYAKARQAQGVPAADASTMSDEFARHITWAAVAWGALTLHLVLHNRLRNCP